jgi:hypothetical protein
MKCIICHDIIDSQASDAFVLMLDKYLFPKEQEEFTGKRMLSTAMGRRATRSLCWVCSRIQSMAVKEAAEVSEYLGKD